LKKGALTVARAQGFVFRTRFAPSRQMPQTQQILYSARYNDDEFEYRHVIL